MSKKGKHSQKNESKSKVNYKILKIGISICVIIAIGIIIYSQITQNKEEADEKFGLASEKIDFVIEGDEPMTFDSTLSGKDLFEEYLKPGWHHSLASHGYLPFRDETTAFLAFGKNVKEGVVIERGSMLNEAATMAAMLGLKMEDTEGIQWQELIK